MKKLITKSKTLLFSITIIAFLLSSCKKSALELTPNPGQEQSEISSVKSATPANPNFNLEVILRGEDKSFGLVKFRQDNDVAKIISLETWVRNLEPNHSYRLQRAVDAINVVDGNCTSTSWLTLGNGLAAQDIITDDNGTGTADLWRSVAMLATGSSFDIHFQIIDAVTSAVVLTSDCYNYTVR